MLGERIRSRRKELGYSLQYLAKETGLTSGFLSQIERGLVDPSISSLRRIAETLKVAVFYFLLEESATSPVVRKDERKTIMFQKSHISYELMCSSLDKQMEMFLMRLQPGAKSCEEPSAHLGEEIVYVQQGVLCAKIGIEQYILHEGDTIYYFGNIPHQMVNVGQEELVIISVVTPPLF